MSVEKLNFDHEVGKEMVLLAPVDKVCTYAM